MRSFGPQGSEDEHGATTPLCCQREGLPGCQKVVSIRGCLPGDIFLDVRRRHLWACASNVSGSDRGVKAVAAAAHSGVPCQSVSGSSCSLGMHTGPAHQSLHDWKGACICSAQGARCAAVQIVAAESLRSQSSPSTCQSQANSLQVIAVKQKLVALHQAIFGHRHFTAPFCRLQQLIICKRK